MMPWYIIGLLIFIGACLLASLILSILAGRALSRAHKNHLEALRECSRLVEETRKIATGESDTP